MARSPLPKTPKGLPPLPGQRRFDAQTLSMIVGLASEVTVLRARLDACERLLVAGGSLTAGAIDQFEPDASAQQAREAQRLKSMAKIFRSLTETAEAELAELDSSRKTETGK